MSPVQCRLGSFFESFTAVVSIVNALLTALSIQNPEEMLKKLEKQEGLWKTKKIYMAARENRFKK